MQFDKYQKCNKSICNLIQTRPLVLKEFLKVAYTRLYSSSRMDQRRTNSSHIESKTGDTKEVHNSDGVRAFKVTENEFSSPRGNKRGLVYVAYTTDGTYDHQSEVCAGRREDPVAWTRQGFSVLVLCWRQ